MKSEIAVIGELNPDLIAGGVERVPQFGAEVLAERFAMTLGSASAIFACGAARLGRTVAFTGQVGRDRFGEFCVAELERLGVGVENVRITDENPTGVTIVLSGRADRAMVTFPGAIAAFGMADIDLDGLEGCRHLHLTSYFLQTALRPDFGTLASEARRRGLSVSFDPNSDPANEWPADIFEVLAACDIVFLNESEVFAISGRPDLEKAIDRLGARCRILVVKLGARGAVCRNGGETVFEPGFPVEAVDTTGAGDSFAAGFVDAWLDGAPLKECLRAGNGCGALSTRGAGGTEGQPDRDQLFEFIGRC